MGAKAGVEGVKTRDGLGEQEEDAGYLCGRVVFVWSRRVDAPNLILLNAINNITCPAPVASSQRPRLYKAAMQQGCFLQLRLPSRSPTSALRPRAPPLLPPPPPLHTKRNVWQGQRQVQVWQGLRRCVREVPIALCEGGSPIPRRPCPPSPQEG